MSVRDSKSLLRGSTTSKGTDLESVRECVDNLLNFCAANDVNVPDELKQSLLSSLATESVVKCDQSVRSSGTHKDLLVDSKLKRSEGRDEIVVGFHNMLEALRPRLPDYELRVQGGSYTVTNYYDSLPLTPDDDEGPRRAKQKIATVYTASPVYRLWRCLKRCVVNCGDIKQVAQDVDIMKGVNLCLESGKIYLVLGAPGSGKSTLLKMIANILVENKNAVVRGKVSLAGIQPEKGNYWSKLVGYIDQIDRLHPYLTVKETIEFAWQCRSGGTHRKVYHADDEVAQETIKKMDDELHRVERVMQGLGLARVKDTFVGDQERVRGVSGGEKKRVTVAEMLCLGVPVICCDEISTGLDAATTYDITRLLGIFTRSSKTIRVVSLLQPPPETFANFDEVILLSEGRVIYCGPMEDVVDYFEELGYQIPERMDVADWLQVLPTKAGAEYLKPAEEVESGEVELPRTHMNTEQFEEKFYASDLGRAILEKLQTPEKAVGDEFLNRMVKVQYENPWYRSLYLVAKRELLLWWRDKYFIKATVFKALVMGTIVGTLFFQSVEKSVQNAVSIMFQSMFYGVVNAMVLLVRQFPERSIFYKHQDANFFPPWAFVLGRSMSTIPTALIDTLGYGTMIFWLTGLSYNNGASIVNYFMFLLLLFITSYSSGLIFSMFSACVSNVSIGQAMMSITGIILILFSGFTVQPDVIPVYYIWLYWINVFAWQLRGLVVNEFASGRYSGPSGEPGVSQGEAVLTRFGFVRGNGEVYSFEWAWWGILFTLAIALTTMFGSMIALRMIRFSTGGSLVEEKGSDEVEEFKKEDIVRMPFQRVDLTFKDIHYYVTASTSKETLELLKGVDGVVESGKMTALMGSSGAGKTTLMDVLSMRKASGEITGEIHLNGHPQEEISFRRCTGYVEQFDTQSPQLTIRETVEFSAKLRLDENDPAVCPESIRKFTDMILYMLDLTNEQDLQVGTDDLGGLSFEQRKRLSIAVECAANPSVLFLDEPTSGLDARAAAIVMRGMKRIALSGRAVCATIHQPSLAIFRDFDTLLLLKRGGEVVFFGDLGTDSENLINYFERFPATKKIRAGENPATWMLTTIGAGSSAISGKPFDYAAEYSVSKLRQRCLDRIDELDAAATDANKVTFLKKYATSIWTQNKEVWKRALRIYHRSPSYNTVRMIVACIVSLLFASVYASQRVPKNESDMNSRINSIFIAVLFVCVNAQNTCLKVIETERNMFYRHKAANMYNPFSVLTAFTISEIPFVILGGILFTVCFYFLMGLAMVPAKFFLFLLFVILGTATFTFNGHMLVAVFRDSQTAQGVGGILVTCSSLFSGVFIRPSDIPRFWIFLYWILPGHWIMEGLFMSQFSGDGTQIDASLNSPFYQYLGCSPDDVDPCVGSVDSWVAANFTTFSRSNVRWDALFLIAFICFTRCISWYAFANINYRQT